MPTQADRLLAELAVKNHLISAGEAEACLAELDREGDPDLGALLIRKRMIKERHLKSLQKKLGKLLEERGQEATPVAGKATQGMPAPPTAAPPPLLDPAGATFVTPEASASPLLASEAAIVLFGQIAMKLGYLVQADLERALSLQEHLARKGTPMRVGEILVRAKRMTPERVHEVLRYQELYIVRCTVCSRKFNMSASQELAGSLRCGACGGALAGANTTGVGVDGTHSGPRESLSPMQLSGSAKENTLRKPPTAEDPAGLVGLEWKGHRVERVLGRGGMGAVYQAIHKSLNRPEALKVMLRGSGQAAPGERERFEREAKLLANLGHPGIVRVFEAEWDEDLCWFTMELVPGQDFKQTLRSGTFPIRKGAEVVAKVARAMDFAHKKGIIHRDLKPQNVMIDEETGEPKVLDFGLAKNVDQEAMEQLTQMGAFLGTPAYMAPEQAGGDPAAIDHRADVYALGAILYEVLTGRPPFTGKKAIHVIRKVLKEDPVPPRELHPQAPAELEVIALQALRKDRDERQPTAGEVADAIEAVIGPVTGGATPRARGEPGGSSSGRRKGFFGRFLGG